MAEPGKGVSGAVPGEPPAVFVGPLGLCVYTFRGDRARASSNGGPGGIGLPRVATRQSTCLCSCRRYGAPETPRTPVPGLPKNASELEGVGLHRELRRAPTSRIHIGETIGLPLVTSLGSSRLCSFLRGYRGCPSPCPWFCHQHVLHTTRGRLHQTRSSPLSDLASLLHRICSYFPVVWGTAAVKNLRRCSSSRHTPRAPESAGTIARIPAPVTSTSRHRAGETPRSLQCPRAVFVSGPGDKGNRVPGTTGLSAGVPEDRTGGESSFLAVSERG